MRPILPNTKPELIKIRDTLNDLVKIVSEIKSMLKPTSTTPHESDNRYGEIDG
tara:strand:- start:656 stop:814 length:159 start_codon:yes stop_codon:yes gene_type:complete